MFKKINMKQKSMIFMLILISILLLTIYFQNKVSQENHLRQLENAYKQSFDNYYRTFKNNQIKLFSTFTIYLKNNPAFKQELIKKYPYLQSITLKKDIPSSLKPILEKGSYLSYGIDKKNIVYKISSPIFDQKKLSSYMEYVLDTRAFLKSIKSYDGSNGLIYFMDKNKKHDIFLEEYRNEETFKEIAQSCALIKTPVFEIQDHFFVKKNVTLNDNSGKTIANAVFFLDVTKEKKEYISFARTSTLTTILLFIFAGIVVNYFFNYLTTRIQKNEEQLKQINKNLEDMVEKETTKRLKVEKKASKEKQKNEQLLLQQSKLALLGEMIGNIAHQWRQPLMQLSAILMYLDAYNEKKKLTNDRFLKKIDEGNSLIDFMSKTIEDFRNYYQPEKQKEQFFIKQSIQSALFIINSSLKNADIEIEVQYNNENTQIESFKNEFSQALLNIITNAKDILILRKIKKPKIHILVKEDAKCIQIEVLDNAGGIQEEIIDKIFDPYFTTKHQAQGTGIGLYMTKMIIENNMNGKITVKNTKQGANFIIKLMKGTIN